MFNANKYSEHADDNPNIEPDDFTSDPDLIEKVNKEGKINDVRYEISSGRLFKASDPEDSDA